MTTRLPGAPAASRGLDARPLRRASKYCRVQNHTAAAPLNNKKRANIKGRAYRCVRVYVLYRVWSCVECSWRPSDEGKRR